MKAGAVLAHISPQLFAATADAHQSICAYGNSILDTSACPPRVSSPVPLRTRLVPLFLICVFAACGGDRRMPPQGDADVAFCLGPEDCGESQYCVLGQCQDTPPGDSDPGDSDPCQCLGLQICDPEDTCQDADICTTDADCVGDRMCLTGQCSEPPECRFDDDCPDGSVCFGRLYACGKESCIADDDCPSPLVCNVGSSTCADCDGDDDCPGNQVCVGGLCDEGPSCTDDADCVRGRVCTVGECENPSCIGDAAEPNDEFSDLHTGSAPTQTTPGELTISLCQFDVDTLFVPAQTGDGLLLRGRYDDSLGVVFVDIYDSSEALLAGVEGDAGTLTLGVSSLPTDGAYIQLWANPGLLVPVDLSLRLLPGGVCFNDIEEPNESAGFAVSLFEDPAQVYVLSTLCPADEDWFVIRVSEGKSLEVVVDTLEGTPPIAELMEQDVVVLKDSGLGSSKTLLFDNTTGSTRDYFIRLTPAVDDLAGAEVLVSAFVGE